jgi:arylsulfatase A-like enzyme/Tfp pilus assembly protein PilF
LLKNFIVFPFLLLSFCPIAFLFTPSLLSMNGGEEAPKNVLLITIDTLRTDRLSCYGNTSFKTPNIDSLAERGLRYRRAFAHNSLTLPSHTNILLGTTPLFHGVQDNSNFKVKKDFLTLAELLKGIGYSTGAFIGGAPLDSHFGLDQGFDVYDDDFSSSSSSEQIYAERRADQVMDKALTWMTSQASPWFIWIHLFDPHYPYEPPEPFLSRFKGSPYDGEVAYTDHILGRLFNHLEQNHLSDNTLIVFTADHGESLGEHGESTHGVFAYNSTIWVPLIISLPGIKPNKIDQPVSHIDIFPTVCDVLGIEKPQNLPGLSLLSATRVRKIPERKIYFESFQPFYRYGWAPLQGYIGQKDKFFDSPIPELYDLASDFNEKNNLAGRTNLEGYKKTLDQLVLRLSNPANIDARNRIDESTLAKLKSLGYVGGPMSSQKKTFTIDDDIKTLLPIYNRVMKAYKLKDVGQIQEGISRIQSIIQEERSVDFAYSYLAKLFREARNIERALEILREGLDRYPSSSEILYVLSEFLLGSGKYDELIALLSSGTLSQKERDPEFFNRLGIAYLRKNDMKNAINAFEMALTVDEDYVDALFNLGDIYLTLYMNNKDKNALQNSLSYFIKVIELEPNNWEAFNNLGTLYLQLGDKRKTKESWIKTLEINPKSTRTHYFLGMLYLSEGKLMESLDHLTLYKLDFYKYLSAEERMKLDALLQMLKSKF